MLNDTEDEARVDDTVRLDPDTPRYCPAPYMVEEGVFITVEEERKSEVFLFCHVPAQFPVFVAIHVAQARLTVELFASVAPPVSGAAVATVMDAL